MAHRRHPHRRQSWFWPWSWFFPPHHNHHHRHHRRLALIVTHRGHHGRFIERQVKILKPNGVTIMNPIPMTVGHTASFSIVFLDQDGNPMQTTPTPDSPPTWSDDTPATGTLTPGAGGLTASEVAIAAGTDNVSVSLSVNGTAFSASQQLVVSAAPQVLTSIEIATAIQ
jgi:hypothetical protein